MSGRAGFFQLLSGLLLAALMSLSTAVFAQTPPEEPVPLVTGRWETALKTGGFAYFTIPTDACVAQWQSYNPNADPEPATKVSDIKWACHWDKTVPGANTIDPAWVTLRCPTGTRAPTTGSLFCEPAGDDAPEPDCNSCSDAQSASPDPRVGNPIAVRTGAKVRVDTDYASADGLFNVTRRYRSRQASAKYVQDLAIAGFGRHWHGVIPGQLEVYNATYSYAVLLTEGGGIETFKVSNPTVANSYSFVSASLGRRRLSMVAVPSDPRTTYFTTFAGLPANQTGAAQMRLDSPQGDYILFRFAGAGEHGGPILVPIEQGWASGYKIWFDYGNGGRFPTKRRDSFGREMNLTWNNVGWVDGQNHGGATAGNKVLSKVSLPDGTFLNYTYGGAAVEYQDRLEGVTRTNALGSVLWARTYLYEHPVLTRALTGIKDQNGARLSS